MSTSDLSRMTIADQMGLESGDRIEEVDFLGRVSRRGTFRGQTRDGYPRVHWDGDRSISVAVFGDVRYERSCVTQ